MSAPFAAAAPAAMVPAAAALAAAAAGVTVAARAAALVAAVVSARADLTQLASDNAPPPAVETASTLASDRQTMLTSLRGDAPTANLRPGKCCRRESIAADEQTGETRWELASKLDLGPGSAAAAAKRRRGCHP